MPDGQALGMCPYCGEEIDFWIDGGGARRQRYVEDCAVCCRPIEVSVEEDDDGEPMVTLRRQDE
jgi:hypothetical protein